MQVRFTFAMAAAHITGAFVAGAIADETIPPIDQKQPQLFETATFAMG